MDAAKLRACQVSCALRLRHTCRLARVCAGLCSGCVSTANILYQWNSRHASVFMNQTAFPPRRMCLALVINWAGGHVASWKHPLVPPGASMSFDFYRGVAETDERACFDLLFLADHLSVGEAGAAAREHRPGKTCQSVRRPMRSVGLLLQTAVAIPVNFERQA